MAGFNTAVTGLKSATTLLDVAGNNIANSSTVGFKSSRTEFGDIYATAVVGAGSSNTPGSGVTVTDIAQDFSGGTIEFTNSNLDLAINGSGFFQLKDANGNVSYTRAGAFELDKDGFIVSKNGKNLQGYGLDAQGNVLPPRDLSVSQKESPPKATEQIDLSFNINDNEDASELDLVFDKTNPNSYTYSTTVGTYDSLGNENSIRFYFAEQQAIREVYQYSIDNGSGSFTAATFDATPAATADASFGTGADEVTLSGFNMAMNSDGTTFANATVTPGQDTADTDTLYWDVTTATDDGNGNIYYQLTEESQKKLSESFENGGDPRIDLSTFVLNGATGSISYETYAEYTEYGDFAVTVAGVEIDSILSESDSTREANELQYFQLDPSKFTSGTDGDQLGETFVISFGNVDITLDSKLTYEEAISTITSYEQQIIDGNPGLQSIEYNSLQDRVEVKWAAEEGNIDNDELDFPVISGTLANAPFIGLNTTTGVVDLVEINKGDNSFVGSYRTYAFLNDEVQLDIGKLPDPGTGTGAAGESAVGPIMLGFNSTTGVLDTVNGIEVSGAGAAPTLTILGADPANPEDTILDSDTDNRAGIQLDFTGSTQFASDSIVKSQQQDGYAKGDLIGVTFSENGQMVASFSNGQLSELGLVAIATFENQDGLQPAGDTEWVATLDSGGAILNPPGTGLNGTLRSAALEQSNVDLSAELVKLIEGQRNFQANSKTLETLNTVTQAILQI